MRYATGVYLGTVATNKICTQGKRVPALVIQERRPRYFIRGYAAPVHARGMSRSFF